MTLSQTYFYIVVFLYIIFSLIITTFTEDLKSKKIFDIYLRISLIMGLTGIMIESIGWTFFCKFNLTLMAFTPFITLMLCRLARNAYKIILKEEPYAIWHGSLRDGMWVKNMGDIRRKKYYALYSMATLFVPMMMIVTVFVLIDKNLCS